MVILFMRANVMVEAYRLGSDQGQLYLRLLRLKAMNTFLRITALCLLLPCFTQAQFNFGYELRTDIPVIFDSDTLEMPWAGGMNNPQFTSFDLDFDGSEDMLVHELDGGFLKCFLFDHETGEYSWTHDCAKGFPSLNAHFVFMRDYNGDGKKDIITSNGSQGWMWIYKNTSTNSEFSFELLTPGFGLGYKDKTDIFVALLEGNLPSINDVDGDGDLDIFIMKPDPSTDLLIVPTTIILIKNMSMETYGVPDSLVFEEANACWGKISEDFQFFGYQAFDCTTGRKQENPGGGGAAERHPGSSAVTILDLNGDDRLDALMSDTDGTKITAGLNTSDNEDAIIDATAFDTTFPSTDVPIDVSFLPAAYHVDIDFDGKRDLMVAPIQRSNSMKKDVDYFYKNYGSDGNPDFELEKIGYFSSEMIEVGARSLPAFGDVNGDGLIDMAIGTEVYETNGNPDFAKVELYLNVGTATDPVFEHAESDLGAAHQYEWNLCHPALADLNGDGKAEMLIGDDQGRLHYFSNLSTGNTYNFQLAFANYQNIDVGINAHPSFFDFNSDGLPDLMVGNARGEILYYENNGSASEASFPASPTIDQLGDIDLFQEYGGESTPLFTRSIDSVFSLYAFVSTKSGSVLFYGPITEIGGTYSVVDSISVTATETAIAGADLRNDGRLELTIGQRTGGLYFLSRESDIAPGMGELINNSSLLKLYPNPATDRLALELPENEGRIQRLEFIDLAGRSFETNVEAASHVKTSIEHLPVGNYSVIATLEDGRKLVSKFTKY